MAKNPTIPPLDPKRFSTNKRVKVGDKETTSARMVKPPLTAKQQRAADAAKQAVKDAHSPAAKRNDAINKAAGAELDKQRKTGVIKDHNLPRRFDQARKTKTLRTMT